MQDACRSRPVGRATFTAHRLPRLVAFAALLISASAFAGNELWVQEPQTIAFSVGSVTADAKDLGVTQKKLATDLSDALKRHGFSARLSELGRDTDVLFLDVIVEGSAYYASLGFWRKATFELPDASANTDHVIVWQDYAIGTHEGDPAIVRATVSTIVDRFVTRYNAANNLDQVRQVAAER